MKYRRLGSTGLLVSAIGLGTNNFGGRMNLDQAKAVMESCLEHGINFIDTSDTYSAGVSEEYIGKVIKGRRHDFIIATKCGMRFESAPHRQGLAAEHIKYSIEGSLRRLQTDYIDLYQSHIVDPLTPIEETLRAYDDLVAEGKVRYIGCSNFMAWEMVEAIQISRQHGWAEYVTNQPEYSMLVRDAETDLLHASAKYGTGILPYFPLAHGFLTGKYRRGEAPPEGTRLALLAGARDQRLTDENFDVLEQLERFASDRDHTMVDLAFAWLLAHPEVSSVIAGASRPEQVAQNAATADWTLSPEEMAELNTILPDPGPGIGRVQARRKG